MPELPRDVRSYLETCFAERRPRRLLVVAPETLATDVGLGASDSENELIRMTAHDAAAELDALAHFDLAVVLDPAREIDARHTTLVLARLRNVGASAVIVAVPGPRVAAEPERPTRFGRGELIALGFRRAHGTARLDSGWLLYDYDIHDYKITPDWLNARYWANPRRWDKKRW